MYGFKTATSPGHVGLEGTWTSRDYYSRRKVWVGKARLDIMETRITKNILKFGGKFVPVPFWCPFAAKRQCSKKCGESTQASCEQKHRISIHKNTFPFPATSPLQKDSVPQYVLYDCYVCDNIIYVFILPNVLDNMKKLLNAMTRKY